MSEVYKFVYLYFVESGGESDWPTADYITDGMIFKGAGNVVMMRVAPGQFVMGEYEWQGVAADGRCITFLFTEQPTKDYTGTDNMQLIIRLFSQTPNAQ